MCTIFFSSKTSKRLVFNDFTISSVTKTNSGCVHSCVFMCIKCVCVCMHLCVGDHSIMQLTFLIHKYLKIDTMFTKFVSIFMTLELSLISVAFSLLSMTGFDSMNNHILTTNKN